MLHAHKNNTPYALNQSTVEELRLAIDEKFSFVVQLYLKDTRTRLETIAESITCEGKADIITRMAHSIRSASAQLGADQLADLANTMETTTRTQGNAAAPEELLALLKQMQMSFQDVEMFLGNLCAEQDRPMKSI